METIPRDYSIHQRGRSSVQFWGGPITELIAHPPTIAFLKELFGDRIIMMSYGYDRSEPGHPGISLHSDGQPWGSRIFGYNLSCPRLVRVLYYLERPDAGSVSLQGDSPIPSELPQRRQPLPPLRRPSRAGDGHLQGGIGRSDQSERFPRKPSQRPAPTPGRCWPSPTAPPWAGPGSEIDPWDPEELAKVPPAVREVMGDRNTRIWNYGGGNQASQHAPGSPRHRPQPLGTGELILT